MVTIRPHKPADAAAIGVILADGWKQAYSAFMPAERLKTHADRSYRIAEIGEFLANDFDPEQEAVFVAETGGALRGFIHLVLEDKAELGAEGSINLLYVDQAAQGQGIGRALLGAAAQWFAARTTGPIAVSAFAENPFGSFYAHVGARETLRRSHDVAGTAIESVIYLWPDAAALARGANA